MYTAEFYRQQDDGAVDIDGGHMPRGWYWVRVRCDEWGTPIIGAYDGLSVGPFRTKQAAQDAYRVYRMMPPTLD